MDTFAVTWNLLPESVKRGLLVGSEGKLHLMHLAQELLVGAQGQSGGTQGKFLDLGLDLLQAAWSKDPLDGQIAAQLLSLDEKWPRVNARNKVLLRQVADRWCKPDDLRYYRRLAESRDSEKIRRFLLTQLGKEQGNLYWWQQVLTLGMFEQDQELLGSVLRQDWSGLEPCRKLLAGDMAWLSGQHEAACGAYGKALGGDALWRRAERMWAAGQQDEARALWRDVLSQSPWMVGETLRLFDIRENSGQRLERLDGKVAIALYSFNKAAELDATLESLFASNIGENPVWVLDNGSTDGTAAVLAAWQDKAGARLHRISLHVNIGAPAARNWLMSVPEIRDCRWIVYLDDDVELPGDWLGRLGAAAQAYPEAGVWGCKVVDHAQPGVLQSVDLHLLPPLFEEAEQEARRFKVSDLHHQTLDFGQFDYLRPCASVTGCCHLFRMDRLQEIGGFDLRFSPSQYDDLEHDIRLNLAGQYAVYQGFLSVKHKKRTGKSSQTSTAEFGNSFANMHKLQKKYSATEYDRAMAWETEVITRDFWVKREKVRQWLAGESE